MIGIILLAGIMVLLCWTHEYHVHVVRREELDRQRRAEAWDRLSGHVFDDDLYIP